MTKFISQKRAEKACPVGELPAFMTGATNPEARLLLGEVHLANRNIQASEKELRRACASGEIPDDDPGWLFNG